MATTSITASGQSLTVDLSDSGTAVIAIRGTFNSFAGAFEVSPDGGDNWFPVLASRSDSGAVEATVTGLTNTSRLWRINTIGMNRARLRCTGLTSGTVAAFGSASAQAIDPAPAIAVASALPAGSNNIGNVTNAASTNLMGDVGMQVRANATGATTIKHVISGASTNATSVKASAGRLLGWTIQNTNAAARYVKFHNTAGAPTAGSGVVMTIGVPPNWRSEMSISQGIGFATGIAITTTTGAADADTAAVGANDLVIDLFYA